MAENYFGLSDVGRQRDNNEDAFIAEKLSTGWILACVIDGVGGYEGGEVAAEIARSTIAKKVQNASGDVIQILRDAVLEANRNIYNEKVAGKGNSQMACVLTVALVDAQNNQFFYAHVGDTRMYLLRDGSLVKVTKDHSFVGFLEDSGRLSEAEAMSHPKRNEINKALGFDAQIDLKDDYIETGQSPFLPGDLLLLCSDGLTDLVNNQAMTKILVAQTSLQQKAKSSIDAANNAGGKDNITVVLVTNDKKPQKQKATKPVLVKKSEQQIDNKPASITREETKPKLVEPSTSKPKRSNLALRILLGLSLLLALGCFWLWTKNRDLQASLPKPAPVAVRNAEEKRLHDSLGLAHGLFIFSDSGRKAITLSDTLFVRQDSLHINGNGLVLQKDSLYNGPALVVSPNNKFLLLENITFNGFDPAVVLQGKGLQLKNVQFQNSRTPVQRNILLPSDHSVTASFRDTVLFKKRFVTQITLMSFLRNRNLERVFLFALAAVMLYLFSHLFDMLRKKYFDEVPKRMAEGSIINVNSPKAADNLAALLQRGFYFEDPRDIDLIHSVAAHGFAQSGEMNNIGELNKRAFEISTDDAYLKGGESFRRRAKLSRTLIGFTGNDSLRFDRERTAPPSLPATVKVTKYPVIKNGYGPPYTISGKITDVEKHVVGGVLVRLQMILPQDKLYSEDVDDEGNTIVDSTATVRKTFRVDSSMHRQLVSLQAYARTDANGVFSFTGLPDSTAFEVIPLKPGYQFGSSKGVQDLNENVSFTFTQVPHKMKLFSTRDFNNLRREKALIVRMPEEVTKWYWTIVVVFFAGFFLLHLFLSFRFPQADQLLLPILMLLTGISFLTLLSLQDPLRDRFFGRSTLAYFGGGVLGIFILLFFNLRKFTTDSGLFRLFVFKNNKLAANGWPWAIAAMGLLMLTILMGTGPEGSGVKVNLFGFQPSEIVKFLIVVFLAGFFATNEKFISEYGRWQKRWRFFGFALIAILGVLGLFLWLGDLGPAMVACFTFIILFSFSRGDFAYAVGTAAVYVLSIWLTHNNILLATAITVALLLLAMAFIKKQMTESAIMLLVVMASFLLLDQVPYIGKVFPGPVQRLIDRKAIWQDPWNNEVFGGDQIANGLWAMSSGGVQGQGIGEGFAKTIPEAHTDMILPSMGEEFGWAGIICVFIAFVLYLHRAVLIGRQTGTPVLFYLCSGIGIATFVQFLLIAGGSVGALPLSGVSLPFMSYGGSSLIANMLAAGFLLSSSVVQGSPVQMKYISRQQDRNIMPALIAAFIGVILLGVNVGQYLFNNKKWVVQPALVADRSGARMFSYNPRIAILMNRIGAGNLLDRKGRVLATGNPDAFLKQQDSLIAAGLKPTALQALSHKRLDRYYPFYESMFFWVGDMNTGAFMGSTNGYYGEYEHMAELRGFPAPETKFTVKATRFRENRFLPQTAVEMSVAKRDFSALAPLLLAGINSAEVEKFKQRNRDVQMTMDAALQTNLQSNLQTLDSFKNSRISVVVMESNTGDVLASAMYPAAPVNEPERMSLSNAELNHLPYFMTTRDLGFTYATQPGSTAKLITASAAFNKLGTETASHKTITVRPGDLIRVKSEEPDEAGTITIERGIVKSNNPFFIRLANELRLEEDMGDIYLKAGLFLRGVGGYFYDGDLTDNSQWEKWKDIWRKTEFNSIRSYNPNDIKRTRGRGISGMAWGQGELIATPAAIARVASAIANNGTLMHNRYVLKISDSTLPLEQGIPLLKDPAAAALMTKYMREQSANKKDKLGLVAAGKTGTPERILKGERINDGWYVFFAPKQNGEGDIVTCVRIEKTKGSSNAVRLAGSKVVPLLKQFGYIKSFEEAAAPSRPSPTGKVTNRTAQALRRD